MLIKNVQIKNLFSFEEVNIELEGNIYLVTGINLDENGFESNGSGKTSLLNSIYWCLFNKVIDKRDSSEVLRLGADKGNCIITFDNNIKLIRKINSKGIKKLTVIQNNTDISADTATDTQTIIDEMLDCNKDSFLLSNFMSSDFSKAFIGKDTSPKDRFETFDKLIGDVANQWEKRIIINAKKNDVKKFSDQLIVIDPVDSNRNMAAAVSRKTLTRFVLKAREFLKTPSEEGFFPKSERPHLRDIMKRKIVIISNMATDAVAIRKNRFRIHNSLICRIFIVSPIVSTA